MPKLLRSADLACLPRHGVVNGIRKCREPEVHLDARSMPADRSEASKSPASNQVGQKPAMRAIPLICLLCAIAGSPR